MATNCQLSKLDHGIRLPCPQALPWGTGESLGTRLGIGPYLLCSLGTKLGIGPYSVKVYMYVKFLELAVMHSWLPMLNCTQVLEGMSEKIRMGIEAAETDLSKEKEKKQQEEVRAFCSALESKLPLVMSLPIKCYVVCVTLFCRGC